MHWKQNSLKVLIFPLLAVVLLAALQMGAGRATAEAPSPRWTLDLPSTACPWSASDTNCHFASPAVADLTGDGRPEIVVATNKGHVVAVRANGSVLWDRDVAPAFGMAAGTQRIVSSPAVADVDADGKPEVVVGTGTQFASICTQGGVIVLEDNGTVKSGWPFLTKDAAVPPSGCRDSVFGTPALGDLDRDGDLEIVFGSFDKRLYALHHNATPVNGFPPDSFLSRRFPHWADLRGRFADTVWSSPALADLNQDGYLDIVIGTDEGNFDSRYGGDAGGWECPYATPGNPGYCGGSLYAVDRHGNVLPGFPKYFLETIQSTPALSDVTGDGRPEIFVGTGSYYRQASADKPTYGFRVFGFDSQGNPLPGWGGGKQVGETVPAAPVIGDITGDGAAEIVVAARDKKLYAWHSNGRAVSGFPMTPKTHFGQTIDNYDIPTSFVLADYTGDGKMEIIFNNAAEVIVVDGSGNQLTAANTNQTRPFYYTGGTLSNTPAVADLDGNGRLELVAANSTLFVWNLPNSSTAADWPMFKHDPARTSASIRPALVVVPESLTLLHEAGQSGRYEQMIALNVGASSFSWSLDTNQPNRISFPQQSGTARNATLARAIINVGANVRPGERDWGQITITAEVDGREILNTPSVIPVKVRVVNQLHRSYLPITRAQQ